MIAGTVYGVVLNDARERAVLDRAFDEAPYGAPPVAPVVYVKPGNCLTRGGASVPLPSHADEVRLAPTIALLFGRDARHVAPGAALTCVAAACLALDVSLPQKNYYRPAIAENCRDGFLPIGDFATPPDAFVTLTTLVDGDEVHRWSLDRLVRPVGELVAVLSTFMTLRAGDLLLVGLPGDAPLGRNGQDVEVRCDGLPSLRTRLTGEAE